MCGRFALAAPEVAVREVVETETVAAGVLERPRYNICPTQPVAVARLDAGGAREVAALRWGFIPHWYEKPGGGPLLINARAETLHQKPAFREACRARRCLIPATGFFEWKREGAKALPAKVDAGFASGSARNKKTPFFADPGGLILFAGVWQRWRGEDGEEIDACAIVTCAANETLAPIHHRMPVVIAPERAGLWLGEEGKGAAVLMKPAPEALFRPRAVGSEVNKAGVESPSLIVPL